MLHVGVDSIRLRDGFGAIFTIMLGLPILGRESAMGTEGC